MNIYHKISYLTDILNNDLGGGCNMFVLTVHSKRANDVLYRHPCLRMMYCIGIRACEWCIVSASVPANDVLYPHPCLQMMYCIRIRACKWCIVPASEPPNDVLYPHPSLQMMYCIRVRASKWCIVSASVPANDVLYPHPSLQMMYCIRNTIFIYTFYCRASTSWILIKKILSKHEVSLFIVNTHKFLEMFNYL